MASQLSIERKLQLPVPPERVFAALITPSDLAQWWQASSAIVLPQTGGLWIASWGDLDDPDYIVAARLLEFDPPQRLVMGEYQYQSRFGDLPFDADLRTEFTVSASAPGATLRVLKHAFPLTPDADEDYRGCEEGWDRTLASMLQMFDDAPPAS